jgi:hypothetical protein
LRGCTGKVAVEFGVGQLSSKNYFLYASSCNIYNIMGTLTFETIITLIPCGLGIVIG